MLSRLTKYAHPIITGGLSIGAAFLLYHALKDLHLPRLWQDLRNTPLEAVLLSTGLTFASHAALTLYDYLGARYIRARLTYPQVALAAFLGYSISHSLGFPAVTGGAIRYRVYSRWGLGVAAVARIMGMAGITLFLGMFLLGGLALLLEPSQVKAWTSLPPIAVDALGATCLAIVAFYALMGFARRTPVRIFGYAVEIPRPGFAFVQILVGGVDWILVSSVLYVLLPPHALTFVGFVGVFVLAYMLGTLSNVPGGLGIFDSVILIALTPAVPPETVVSSLLVYRGIYHLLPLILGGTGFFALEFSRPRQIASRQPTSAG